MSRRLLVWIAAASALSTVVGGVAAAATTESRRVRDAAAALKEDRPSKTLAILGTPGPDDPPDVRYLRGTALLWTGREEDALSELAGVTALAGDPTLMHAALHNLALAHLHVAAGASGPRKALEARASVAAARDALRLDASDAGARWNLALAERLIPGESDGGGRPTDDGGRTFGGGEGSGQARAAPNEATAGARSRAEAIQILDALRSLEGPSLTRAAAHRLGGSWRTAWQRGPTW